MPAPAIGVRPRWRPEPTDQVDWSHPLAADLVGVFLPIAGVGAVNLMGGDIPLVGAPSHVAGAWGREMRTTGTNTGAVVTTGTTGPYSLQPPVTIMWVGTVYGAEEENAEIFACTYDNANGSPYLAYALGWTGGAIKFESNDNGAYVNITGGSVPNGPTILIATVTPAERWLYRNGVLDASASGYSIIQYSATASFGFHWYGAARDSDVGSVFGAVWSRGLSLAEAAMLNADPFCFLRR